MFGSFLMQAPKQWKDFIQRNPDQEGGEPSVFTLTETFLKNAQRINFEINALFYRADERDFWQIAMFEGDCEDLMLAKRARLQDLGCDFGALRPVICKTELEVGHAVLCLVTDLGDYILDNRYSLVMPWRSLQYTWKLRWAGRNWEILTNG